MMQALDASEVAMQAPMALAATPSGDAATEPDLCTVSVRNLCAFAAKSGDLDLRFTPSPTAQQGREGHQWVAQRRGPQHQSEVSLSGRFEGLVVRGRADGFDPHTRTLEEVKTFRGALANLRPQHQALHWAQLKVYGWLMCQSRELEWLNLSLVYFDVVEQTETPVHLRATADVLRCHFDDLCQRYLVWARQERDHRALRDAALAKCGFPQLPFRAGQRELAAAVYRSCVASQSLLVQAPTGIGKTIGTVYPALRAMPQRGTDKLFFLTAKTTGRPVALEALQQVRASASNDTAAFPLRVIELVAKDKACEHRDKACHGDSCPLARGFYDRLPAAREAAAQVQWLDQQALRTVALAHTVCPYYLGHEMVRWSDVIVSDYNYYFDRTAMLHALTVDSGLRVSVLVDEAHNLVPRGCAMYSADLCHAETVALRVQAPAALRAPIDALLNQWQVLQEHRTRIAPASDWTLLDAVPEAWLRALHRLNLALSDHVNATVQEPGGLLLAFYFRTLAIASLAESPTRWYCFRRRCNRPTITWPCWGCHRTHASSMCPARFAASNWQCGWCRSRPGATPAHTRWVAWWQAWRRSFCNHAAITWRSSAVLITWSWPVHGYANTIPTFRSGFRRVRWTKQHAVTSSRVSTAPARASALPCSAACSVKAWTFPARG